ncbi:MAG: sugar transferase, partial [Lachnospiraceae bacterium]|nr:sugar transferase [Lachnospiraceae bacterium]
GDMSFIGPRPLLTKYLPYYSQQERLRHSVRPGLTGYAQVHGRNAVSWEKRFEYDVWYVQHLSLLTDIKIILDTVRVVLTHDGVELNCLEDFDEYRKKQSVSDIQT